MFIPHVFKTHVFTTHVLLGKASFLWSQVSWASRAGWLSMTKLVLRSCFGGVVMSCMLWLIFPAFATAQDGGRGEGISQAELQSLAAEAARNREQALAPEPNAGLQGNLNFLKLLIEGGALMIPIGIMSLLVVAVVFERFMALRTARLLPRGLRREIRKYVDSSEAISPHGLYQLSERYRSSASRILQGLLGKIGRPVPEMEATISEATQREAEALYGNVRWLTLAAAVTPLIGLLGTVWGMIIAFYNTTQLGSGMNKAEFLAEGIYVALVTTLGGLAVAIPAAIFAHYFEGRITKKMGTIEVELKRLIPRFEELEGKTRYDINVHGLVRRDVPATPVAGTHRGVHDVSAPPAPPAFRSTAGMP
jgi:biopolymer transport protein ExbB